MSEVVPSAITGAFDALLATGPLSVAFQPIVDLVSGQIEAYEVLGRCGPIPGPLAPLAGSPARLLDAAHACGRLVALDRRWRELALAAVAAEPDDRVAIFLNVDPRVAEDPAFEPGFTRRLVAAHGLCPERFVLELTETTAASDAIERVLRHYAEQGFRIAIDDLGAGAQSMGVLLRLRPDVIKLDGSLVRSLDRDPRRAELIRALAEFGERTGARLVAENIETPGELRAVREAGVHAGQGFLLGRPAATLRGTAPPIPRTSGHAARRASAPGTAAELTAALLRLVEHLARDQDVHAALHRVTACAREVLGVSQVSLRLLDESRQRLLVAARSGPSVHRELHTEFSVGEGLLGWIVANATPLRLGSAESDPRFVARPHQVTHVGSFLGVPLFDADGCIGVISAAASSPDRFSADHEERLRLVAGIVAPHLQMVRLRRLARTDPVTCLLNRHALADVLPEAFAGTAPLSVAMVDIDHFKQINDRFGHQAGDEALRAVASTLAKVVRDGDHVLRVGGEEFLVVLPGVGAEGARAVAERARFEIAESGVVPGERVTASAGVAQRRPCEPREELLVRADAALYRAKDLGRNCVVLAG